MKGPTFRVVKEKMARNPVAQAVARANTVSAVRDMMLGLYLWEDGTEQESAVRALSMVLAVAIRVMESAGKADLPDCRVMVGAMSALAQCSQRGFKWRNADAPAIDAGISRALKVYLETSPTVLRYAWAYVRELESQA